MGARWWYFAVIFVLVILPVYPWSKLNTPKQTHNKLYKSLKITSLIVPRHQQKHLYMTNKDVNDEDNHNEENDDEDYEVFENTPDFTTLGHKIVSTTNDRVEVLFIKLVMSRLKEKYYTNNKVIDYNYLEDRYKSLFYYSTIETGINDDNKKNVNNFFNFINELLMMSSMKVSSYQQSDINPLVTGQIEHVIEPRNIGMSLVNEVVQVYKDLITSLQLIIKENAECVKYAALYVQEGAAIANKDRKSIFTSYASTGTNGGVSKNNIDTFISTFKLLNVFVTNCALDNIKNQLLMNNMPVICKWFDDFIQDVAASDTVNSIISSRIPTRSKINKYTIYNKQLVVSPLDDMYEEGTPRDLVERLVLNGLLALADERANKLYKQSNANTIIKNISPTRSLFQENEYIGDTSIPKVSKDPDEDDVDLSALNDEKEFNSPTKNNINNKNQNQIKELEVVNTMGQSLVDGRGAYASEVLSIIGGISDSFKSKFSDEIRVIENKDVLSSLNLQNIAALSPSIEVNAYKYQVEINKNNTDNTTISNSRVTSGGTAGSGSDNGSNDMDSLSSAGITNNVGWKAYEDNSQTKADPSGSRKKPSVGVIDPPNNEKPPKFTDRDSDDNVIEDTRNYVDYGDIELGSIDDFKNLGRNARIRLIGDKIDDDGRRLLCLEVLSDSISPQNPFKRWVIYEEAMILLGVITETENLNNNEDNTNDDNDKDIFSYYSQVSQM